MTLLDVSIVVVAGASSANVLWLKSGGENHRKAYGEEQLSEFLAEVEGAESYLSVLGWAVPEGEG